MFLFSAVALVIFINENAVKSQSYPRMETKILAQTTTDTHLEPKKLKTAKLAKFIHRVNKRDEDVEHAGGHEHHVGHKNDPRPIDLDYLDIRHGDEDTVLSNLVRLIQKNRDFNKGREDDAGVRIHVIENPRVLEQFKEDLKTQKQLALRGCSSSSEWWTSSYSSDFFSSDFDSSSDYDWRMSRRNAVFRLGNKKEKLALRNDNNRYKKNSIENDKFVHFERDDDNENDKVVVTFKDSKHDGHDNKPYRTKDVHKSSENLDSWEQIANRDQKIVNKNNEFIENDKYYHKNDDYKKNEKNNGEFKKKYRNSDDLKTNDRYDYDFKKEFNYNADFKRNDEYNDDHKKSHKHNEDYDTHWNDKATGKKNENRDTNADLDKPKDSKTDKKANGWGNWKSKSMEGADEIRKNKRDKNDDWEQPPKKGNRERRDKNDWNLKEVTFITTENRSNKKAHVPKISDYYNPRPKLRDYQDRPAFKAFGRTSIPFVGKKGIYEETN